MSDSMYVDYSKIHGKGMFARRKLKIGEEFDIVHSPATKSNIHCIEDPEGNHCQLYNPFCFINHSDDPNAVIYFDGEEFTLEIIRNIKSREEVTFDYEG